MNTYLKSFLSLLLVTILFSCNQKKNISSETTSITSNKTETTKTKVKATSTSFNNDCFNDRAVTKEVTNKEVTMTKALNMFMFSFENTRWQACEVPEEFHKEGMKVKVSGQVLEIRPNERRAGTPFNITALSKL